MNKVSDIFLNMLLESQAHWDSIYSGNILDMPALPQLCHYLNHLAKYSNHKDFRQFMKNKKYHKTKTDFLIMLLCIMNQVNSGGLPQPAHEYSHLNTYQAWLEKIFWLKDEYDHTNDDETLLGLYAHVHGIYKRYMLDFGLNVLEWLDTRRSDYKDKVKPSKRKKKDA